MLHSQSQTYKLYHHHYGQYKLFFFWQTAASVSIPAQLLKVMRKWGETSVWVMLLVPANQSPKLHALALFASQSAITEPVKANVILEKHSFKFQQPKFR